MHKSIAVVAVSLCLLRAGKAMATSPLDPLSAREITTAVQLMKADSRLAGAAFPLISLAEPPKADVLARASGRIPPRQAYAVVMTKSSVFEVIVDLDAKKLASVTERPGAEAPVTMSEVESVNVVLSNPEFQEGLKKRGVTDFKQVFCAPWSAGYYGIPEYDAKRIVKVGCFDTRKTTTNLFGWPIERLYAIVDLREHKVLSVRDDGVVPIAPGDRNYTEAAVRQLPGGVRAPRKPTLVTQPQGSNIRIDGHDIAWSNWRFHARIDGRVGTIISLARWMEKQQPRSVLYEGYLSEMFVPYMDPDYGWYSRTYFDTGEYGAGLLATPLKPGIDCPTTAKFLPAVFNDDKGQPFTTPNAMCLFERSTGGPIWRHSEVLNHTYEGRANTELVVRMTATIGNYDYIFDWIFNDAAEIEVRVGATGIDSLKGVPSRSMDDPGAAADTRYGALVAPNLIAVNHDHYFNFRLDLDVDGPSNSFIHDIYTPVTLPPDSPRRSMYVVEPHIAATEKNAQLDTHTGAHASPAKFRVANESKKNAVGNPVSYDVVVANHARLLLDPQDWPAKRAQFLQHDLWVTPIDPAERHAAGEFVYESHGGGGLPAWTAKDRAIRDRDIVVWVNIGMHHLTRAEDLPVMPTVWHSFTLRPHNFFDRNPAIDLPAAAPAPATTRRNKPSTSATPTQQP